MTAGVGIKAGLLLVAVTFKSWAAPPPAVMPVSGIVRVVRSFSKNEAGVVIGSSVGGTLSGMTVTVNVRKAMFWPPLAVPPSSVTVTVITAVPLAVGSAMKLSVPVVFGLV